MLGKLLYPTIEELIRDRDFRTLKAELSQLSPPDLADLLEDLDEDDFSLLFRLLPKDIATEVFEHLEVEYQQTLLKSLSRDKVKSILEEMSVDDRTALLDECPPEVASQLFELLPTEERALAQTILNYPEYTVGRLITPDYVSLSENVTVAEALDKIRRFGKDMETVYACYVIGKHRKLLGYVSLRRLVTSPLDARIEDLYERQFASLHTDTPQEEAVELFRHYDLIALPVLDRDGHMVGIVTFDDMMDVAEEEFREDIDMMAAVVPGDAKEFFEETILSTVWRRVPWLVALLVVEGAAVVMLARYDALLEQVIALSFFLPALIATGGNTGTQSAAMVIRALAVGEVTPSDLLRISYRAVVAGIILSIILGIAAYGMAIAIKRDPLIGACVGLGLATVVILANIAGSVFPLILKKMKLDPALMSSPFISTLVDIFGLVIYLEISRYILSA